MVAGDQANPIQHLHQQVSLTALSNEQLDALELFASMLIEQKGAEDGKQNSRS